MIGVLMSSSCLITSRSPALGLFGISDGKVADRGVLRGGAAALGDRGALMVGGGRAGLGESEAMVARLDSWVGENGSRQSDGDACGGQRVSRGSSKRRETQGRRRVL